MNPEPPLIELEHAVAGYAQTPGAVVVEAVNWVVARGDFWLVTGLPGSGKSQVLQTAAGVLPPLAGRHRLFGRALDELSPADVDRTRRRIGYVFANGGRLFRELTVRENISLPLCYHLNCAPSAVTERVDALLELMTLRAFGERLPSQLNRTLRPRVALARALAIEPEVLLLDDPLGGIDARQARWWEELLVRLMAGDTGLAARPSAVVVATDDPQPWIGLARQFAVIGAGRWLPLGGRAEAETSQEPAWRELLAGNAGEP